MGQGQGAGMLSKFGAGRGARLVAGAGAAALVVTGLGLMAAPAGATPKYFTDVPCNAHVQEINLDTSTTQNFTVEATSPTEANAGSDVVVTIPAGDTALPSSATAQGATFTINNFTNLSNQYVVHGGSVVGGSI